MSRALAPPYSRAVSALAVAVMLFVLLPVAFIALYAFNQTAYLSLPPQGLTLHWFASFFANARFRNALGSSLAIALAVTPMALLVALPAALALVRYRFPGRDLVNLAVMSPLVVPGVVTGISFLSLAAWLGVGLGLWTLIAAMTCLAFPYALRALVANLHGLDPGLEDAARNLGATRLRAFAFITVPQLKPGLLAGGIFVFVEAIDNFSTAVFLTDSRTTTLPVEAFSYIRDYDDPTVAAMAVLLMAFSAFLVLAVDRLVGLDRLLDLR